jgi:predicted O-methyltransferase YrrM
MAQVLPPGGKVITLELDPERAELSRRNAERAQVAGRVEVRAGVATEALSALAERSFDLTFIDADKASYPEYLAWALKLTRPRGFIVADNVWRAGSVLDPDPNDVGTQALAEFNRELAVQPRLFTTFIANRDCADAASVSLVRE